MGTRNNCRRNSVAGISNSNSECGYITAAELNVKYAVVNMETAGQKTYIAVSDGLEYWENFELVGKWLYNNMLTLDWHHCVLEFFHAPGKLVRLRGIGTEVFEQVLVDFWLVRNNFVKSMCKNVSFFGVNIFTTDDGGVYAYKNCEHIMLLGLSSATSYIYINSGDALYFYIPFNPKIWVLLENGGKNRETCLRKLASK